MTVKHVKKYVASSPAAPKSCMKRPRTGIRSTTKPKQQPEKIQEEPIIDEEDTSEINFTVSAQGHMIPEDNLTSNVLCFVALANKNKGTLCTDVTSTLLVRTIDGN